MENRNGVFFSIWIVDAEPILRYNVHSKKFRDAGYPKIAARQFAERFREAAKVRLKSWSAVETGFGPGTLFEGHIPLVPDRLAEDTLMLMNKFAALAPIIDSLLARRQSP